MRFSYIKPPSEMKVDIYSDILKDLHHCVFKFECSSLPQNPFQKIHLCANDLVVQSFRGDQFESFKREGNEWTVVFPPFFKNDSLRLSDVPLNDITIQVTLTDASELLEKFQLIACGNDAPSEMSASEYIVPRQIVKQIRVIANQPITQYTIRNTSSLFLTTNGDEHVVESIYLYTNGHQTRIYFNTDVPLDPSESYVIETNSRFSSDLVIECTQTGESIVSICRGVMGFEKFQSFS